MAARILMVAVDGGGGSSGADAAAEAARKAAEAAQKAAEEAARKAAEEAAKKAAEAARKAAEEAATKAAEAAQKAQDAKAALQSAKNLPPDDRKGLQDDYNTKNAQAQQAQKAADAATVAAKGAMTAANDAAKAKGHPAPYSNELLNTTRDQYTAAAKDPQQYQKLFGSAQGPSTDDQAKTLAAQTAYNKLASDPTTKGALDAMGIKDGDSLRNFGGGIIGGTAVKVANKVDPAQVQAALKNLDPTKASSIISTVGQFAPDPAKSVLTDPKFADALAKSKSLPDAFNKLTQGDFGGAMLSVAHDPTVMKAAGAVVASEPHVQNALKAVGIDPANAGAIAQQIPDVLKLADQLTGDKPDLGGAVQTLQTIGKNLPPNAFKGMFDKVGQTLASKVPQPAGDNVKAFFDKFSAQLGDPAKNKDLATSLLNSPQLGSAVQSIADGKYTDALKSLSTDPKLVDAAGNAIASIPVVQKTLDTLGIDTSQPVQLSKVLPDALKLGSALNANPPDLKGSVEALQSLGKNLNPAAFKGVVGKLGAQFDKLPLSADAKANLKSFFDGAGKQLGGEKAKDFLNNLVNSPQLGTAVQQLVDGKLNDALHTFAQDPKLLDSLGDAVGNMPAVQKTLSALGLDQGKPVQLSKVLPDALKLSDSLQKDPPDLKGAVQSLQSLGKNIDISTFSGVLNRLGDTLDKATKLSPEAKQSLRAFFDKAGQQLGGEQGKAFLQNLVASPALGDAVQQIADGKYGDALKTLASDPKLLDSAGDALAAMPVVQNAAKALGIDLSSVKPSKVLPDVLALSDAADKGDLKGATTAIQNLAKNLDPKAFQGMFAKVGERISAHVPPQMQAQIKGFFDGLNAKVGSPQGGEFIKALANSSALPDAVDKLGKGDWAGALSALGKDPAVLGGAADALLHMPMVRDGLNHLGINPDGLGDPTKTLPAVGDLANAVQNGKPGDAVRALQTIAGQVKPEAFAGMFQKIGDQLTAKLGDKAPAVKSFFDNLGKQLGGAKGADLVKTLASSTALPDAVDKLANGDIGGAISALGKDPAVVDAAGQAFTNIPQVKSFIQDKLGIDVGNLPRLSEVLPHIGAAIDAAKGKDWGKALTELGQVALAAPDAAKQAIQKLASGLPEGSLARKLISDPKILDSVLKDPATQASLGKIFSGDPDKTLEGAGELLHNDTLRDAVLTNIASDPKVQQALSKIGLSGENLVEAGAAAPHLLDAFQDFKAGKLADGFGAIGDAVNAAPDLMNKLGAKVWGALPDKIQKSLNDLGITPENLKEAGQALPHILAAGQAVADGDWQGALSEVGQSLEAAPDLATKLINKAAEKIPADNPKFGLVRSMLTDPNLVKDLVADKQLHGAVGDLLNGNISDGLKGIASDQKLMTDVSNVLAKDPGVMKKLSAIGIKNADDIAKLGPSIGDAVDAADAIQAGKWGDAIGSLGKFAKDLPTDVRDQLLGGLADKLHLKGDAKNLLIGAIDAAATPEIAQAVGDALGSFKDGNPAEFVQKLAHAGQVIADKDPKLAEGFLDSLSHLPGSVGKFFSSPDLNKAFVESGSMSHLFGAVEKMASGDIPGAVGELGSAITSLITQGDHFKLGPWSAKVMGVGPSFGPYELPFGEQGLKNVGLLMQQFVEAMPPKVKSFIEEKVAGVVAKAGFSSVPVIGPIVGLAQDGMSLYDDFKSNKSGIDKALDVASVVVDGASLVPGFNVGLAPLKTLIGVGKAVNDVAGMIGDARQFGKDFLGMG